MRLLKFKWLSLGLFAVLCALMLAGLGCGGDDDDQSADHQQSDDDATDDDAVADDDASPQPTLRVGAARVDITPDFPVILGGYGMYFLSDKFCRWSTGVHDPIYATAVAIEDGNHQVLIHVVLDSIGALQNDVRRIKDQITQETGVSQDHIIVSATHSHGTPDTVGIYGVILPPKTGRSDKFIDLMVAGAAEAGFEAFRDRLPAIARVNQGLEPNYHFNHFYGTGFGLDPTAKVDDAITVLGFFAPDGSTIATITNWGCHPTTQWNHNTLITADFVGAFYEVMDATVGGVNMFVNGNLGGSVRARNAFKPFTVDPSEGWGTWDEMHTMAEGLAQTATNLLSESVELQNPTFEIVNTEMQAPLQNPLLAIMDKLGVIAHDAPPYGEDYPEPVTAYHFGPLTVATAPGEVVPTIGLELRDIMDGDYKMIVNLGEDWIGYLLTPQEFFDLFVYAEDSMVCAGPAVGKALVATYQQLFAPR